MANEIPKDVKKTVPPECQACMVDLDLPEAALADFLVQVTFEERSRKTRRAPRGLTRAQKRPITARYIYQNRGRLAATATEQLETATTDYVARAAEMSLEALNDPELDRTAVAQCASNRLCGRCIDYFPIPHPPNLAVPESLR